MDAANLPSNVLRGWRRPVFLVAWPALLVIGPPFLSTYWVGLLTQMVIFAILAMSLDILLGYTGLPSLGHAAFFGVAAYAVAVLSTRYHFGFWTCVFGGILVGTLVSAALRPARLARAGCLLPDDHPGDRHGAVGAELPLDSHDRRRQRHLRHSAPRDAGGPAVHRSDPVLLRDAARVRGIRGHHGAARAVAVRADAARRPRKRIAHEKPRLQYLAALLSELRHLRRLRQRRRRHVGVLQRIREPHLSRSDRFVRAVPDGDARRPGHARGPGLRRGRDRPVEERDQRVHAALAADPRHRLHRDDPRCAARLVEPGAKNQTERKT